MTDLRKAAEMALDALDAWLVADVTKLPIVIPQTENTVFALRQALAQPWDTTDMAYRPNGLSVEQEPVAWMVRDCIDGFIYPSPFENPAGTIKGGSKPLYTAPPSKPWQSLTDEEIADAVGSPIDEVYLNDFRKVEAKLKKKNT